MVKAEVGKLAKGDVKSVLRRVRSPAFEDHWPAQVCMCLPSSTTESREE